MSHELARLVYNSSTTSKRSLWPPETADLWVIGAGGSTLRLSDGRDYDDWCSALGANTLGYSTGWEFKSSASLPWQIEHDFAEQFCEAMGTEAVRFFKSGSDAVSCAVRLARAFTKRNYVIAFNKCYHGTGDWFGPGLWNTNGIADMRFTTILPFGQLPLLTDDCYTFPDGSWFDLTDVAAIVVEPVPKAIDLPPEGWLQHLREVCNEHGILLISDEVILGYRHSLRGYMESAGQHADLRCYGKAMGQGAAISACTGRREILGLLEGSVHFSGTNNGEPLPLQIARWTLEQYQQHDVCGKLNDLGEDLRLRLRSDGFYTRGLNSRFEVLFADDAAKKSCVKYCFDNGILFPGFCSMAVSHTGGQMNKLVDTLKGWRDQ